MLIHLTSIGTSRFRFFESTVIINFQTVKHISTPYEYRPDFDNE